ncbi:MAG: efflux RND transporter permease subunit, partial [bacterium]
MKLTDISIRRPVLMTMVILGFVVLGLFSLTRLGIDLTPEVEFPFVVVSIAYPGAGPEEMETSVTDKVEEEFATIPGMRNVTSISQEGLALIICEFEQGVNVDLAAMDVKDKLSLVRANLPREIFEPVIQKFDIAAFPILNLAVSSQRPLEETYRWTEEVIKRRFLKIRGVASVELVGAKEREIQVRLSRRKLREYNLSPQMVGGIIAAANLNIPGGHLEERREEVTVRMEGQFSDLNQIRNLEIPLPKGRKVKLEEIGKVEDTFKEIRERTRFNGNSSIGLGIIKRSGANTVQVAQQVFKELKEVQRELPPDIKVEVVRDRSQFIRDAVDDVFGNLIVGALLTATVLFLFLNSLPITLVATVSIPTSIIST